MNSKLNRRNFLRAAGMAVALPSLEAFSAPAAATVGPRNFVAVGTFLGWHQNAFFPKQMGKNYELPPTLSPLAEYRNDFTVFSGLDHRAGNGHGKWSNFLCGKEINTYSLDQMIADKLGQKSRFASIQLTACTSSGNTGMNFTRRGVRLPMIQRPTVLYKQLFISKEDRARTEYVL